MTRNPLEAALAERLMTLHDRSSPQPQPDLAARVAELEAAIKLSLADATYHLQRYRPHVLKVLNSALSAHPAALAPDVIELVIAARALVFEQVQEDVDRLDKAVEAFSTRVPYEDQP